MRDGCLEDGAAVLLERQVLDRFAQREERLVDVGGFSQRGAARESLSLVFGTREVYQVGASHDRFALLRLQATGGEGARMRGLARVNKRMFLGSLRRRQKRHTSGKAP